jgi:ankyrin repeat protein
MDHLSDNQEQYLIKAAYGSYPYKCPVLSCQRFYRGFPSRKERDLHHKSHDRHFKCIFEDCQFKTIGFSTKTALNAHVTFFHVTSLTHQFSNLKARSLWDTLIDAVDNNESSLVEDLCRQGADSPDRPPGLILRALRKSNAETVKALIKHLGSAEEMNEFDVLICAAVRGDVEVLQLIIESIGTANIDKRLSMSLLRKAAAKGHTEAVRIIYGLHHTYERYQMRPCVSPLHDAAAAGHCETVSLILEHLNEHYTAEFFDAAVRAAMANGAESTVKLLLERGTDNIQWVAESKLLKKASRNGLDISVASLSGGYFAPLVDSKGKAFRNGLQNAALANDIDKIKRFLQQGANIDQLGGENGTAIQAAARKGHVATARFLLDQGAKATVEGGKYGNALAAAAANNHLELVHMLLAAGCNPSMKSRHKTARWNGSGPWRKSMLYQNLTPLHWAAHGKRREIVQILLAAKADIQATTENGYTALHAAVFMEEYLSVKKERKALKERLPLVRLLLEHGADAKARDHIGDTPLHVILNSTRPGLQVSGEVFEVAMILIQYGASLDESNEKGVTPRQIASGESDEDLDTLIPTTNGPKVLMPGISSLVTPTAHAQLSDSAYVTKTPEAHSFDQSLTLTTSASSDTRPLSPKLEPTTTFLNGYSTGESSVAFTAIPLTDERPGYLGMDNSLLINPWADENPRFQATGRQLDPGWNH